MRATDDMYEGQAERVVHSPVGGLLLRAGREGLTHVLFWRRPGNGPKTGRGAAVADAGASDLAARVGRPSAVRAVGAANGANPISIIVPCHRVVGTGGRLTGYGGGLDAKRWLLQHEGLRIERDRVAVPGEAGAPGTALGPQDQASA